MDTGVYFKYIVMLGTVEISQIKTILGFILRKFGILERICQIMPDFATSGDFAMPENSGIKENAT